MADTTPANEPITPPATEPGPAAPPGAAAPEPTAPSKSKPVVLATQLHRNFVLPGAGEDGADLAITPAGVAMTKTQAEQVRQAAEAARVPLRDLSDLDARIDQMKRGSRSPEKD